MATKRVAARSIQLDLLPRLRRKRSQEGANVVDRVGRRYGRLVVLRRAGSKGTAAAWLCRCDCGTTKVMISNVLRAGAKSCGCSRKTGKGSRPSYRSQHPPGASARRTILKQYRWAARKRGLAWELTADDFYRITQEPCFYCGLPPSATAKPSRNGSYIYSGIDRLENRTGYVSTNVVACCSTCNHAKHVMPVVVFLSWIDRLIAHAVTRRSRTT